MARLERIEALLVGVLERLAGDGHRPGEAALISKIKEELLKKSNELYS